jgi:hypothetical protein
MGYRVFAQGFHVEIPPYNPTDIIRYLKSKLGSSNLSTVVEFLPYYEGFKGTVKKMGNRNIQLKATMRRSQKIKYE